MAHDLTHLVQRGGTRPAMRADAILLAPVDTGILDSSVARRLGKGAVPRPRWISERDAIDAGMAFALTFCGAMIFLL